MLDAQKVGQRDAIADRDLVDFTPLLEWARRHRLTDARLPLYGGVIIAVLIALWLTSAVWGGRPPAGDDVTGHLSRANFAVRQLMARGRIDGWNPQFILGYQEFLFLGPGFTWAVGLVKWLSFGSVSIEGAFKTVTLGSFAAVPASVAFLARSFGLSRRASGAAAILSLAVNSPFGGVGLNGLFAIGLVPHQFAAPFFFLALGGTLRVLREPKPCWTIFTAHTLAVLVLSHGRSVFILIFVLAIVIVALVVGSRIPAARPPLAVVVRQQVRHELVGVGIPLNVKGDYGEEGWTKPVNGDEGHPSKKALVYLLTAGVIAAGLAAFILVPLQMHRNLQGIVTDWGKDPLGAVLSRIWKGQLLFRPGVAVLVVAGFAYGVGRVAARKSYALALVIAPIVFMVVAYGSRDWWPNNVATQQLASRGLGYVGVLAILPLAALLGRTGRALGSIGDLAILGAAAAIVVLPLGATRDVAKQMPEPVPQMRAAAAELAKRVPDGARFVTQRDFPGEIERTKVSHPDIWLAWASGRNTLNSFSPESSVSPGPAYESEHILDRPPEVVADALSRLGVTHLVTVSDPAAAQIGASTRFVAVWRSSPLAVFAVSAPAGQPEPGSLVATRVPTSAMLLRAQPERLLVGVNTSEATSATVAVSWSPKWHARLNGKVVALRKGQDGLLELNLPAGPSQLELRFRSDTWDYIGVGISLATVVGLAVWVWGHSRRSVRSDPVPSPPVG